MREGSDRKKRGMQAFQCLQALLLEIRAEFFQRRFRICREIMKKDVPAALAVGRIADLKVPLGWIRELFRQPMLT